VVRRDVDEILVVLGPGDCSLHGARQLKVRAVKLETHGLVPGVHGQVIHVVPGVGGVSQGRAGHVCVW
jgi:hypothetical protein